MATLLIDTTENLIKQGHLVASQRFQEMMAWSSLQEVWNAVASHRVFTLNFGSQPYFPAFYADSAHELKDLEAVTQKLGDLPGGAKLQFFISRKGSLNGMTPLEALANGQIEQVLHSAAAYAEV